MWSGPSNHYWQQFLERTFKGRKDASTVVEKVIVDQLVYGPLCNILLMSYISMVVEGAHSATSWVLSVLHVFSFISQLAQYHSSSSILIYLHALQASLRRQPTSSCGTIILASSCTGGRCGCCCPAYTCVSGML